MQGHVFSNSGCGCQQLGPMFNLVYVLLLKLCQHQVLGRCVAEFIDGVCGRRAHVYRHCRDRSDLRDEHRPIHQFICHTHCPPSQQSCIYGRDHPQFSSLPVYSSKWKVQTLKAELAETALNWNSFLQATTGYRIRKSAVELAAPAVVSHQQYRRGLVGVTVTP